MGILDGKVALITGAGQGVGRGIAFAMAKEGAAIAVAGRTESKIKDTCAEIASFGGKAIPIVCEVKSADDVTRTVAETVAALGGIDILVNNAQEVPLGRLLEARIEDYQTGFDSGPIASLRFMQACYPHLKARGGGSIVNLVTAAAVRWDMAGYGMHASVKQAIRSLTRAAAAEWGPDNIRTNNIAPEALSPGFAGWMEADPEGTAAFIATIPMGRVGDCEQDIGRAVAALCGPAMQYISGATIPVDGGQANFD
ncbi:MAG: Oxidoreductase [Rhodospirillales bacterium]|nr:Oxidoreductase [Rhodospirillales bacterium]